MRFLTIARILKQSNEIIRNLSLFQSKYKCVFVKASSLIVQILNTNEAMNQWKQLVIKIQFEKEQLELISVNEINYYLVLKLSTLD